MPSRVVTREEATMASATECASVGLVCLCYIEPLTMAHLRAAAVAARFRCPQAKVMICVWRDPADDSFKGLERKLRCDAIATGVRAAATAAAQLLKKGSAPWYLAAEKTAAVEAQGRLSGERRQGRRVGHFTARSCGDAQGV